MNKFLLVLTGLALAGSAYAADDTQIKFNGDIKVRYTNKMNESGTKGGGQPVVQQSYWKQRTQFGVTAQKGENITGHVKFLNAGTWGRDATSGDLTAANTTGTDNAVGLQESWVWWKTNSMMSMRFGRGGMTIADGSVVSTNTDEQIPTYFEGVLGTFDFGFATVNAFGVKAAELGTGASSAVAPTAGSGGFVTSNDRESNFAGVSFDFKNLPDAIKMANIHVIMENQDITATAVGKANTRYGLTIGGDVSNFDFKGTYAGVSGKNRYADPNNDVKVNASMFDLAAGYTLADMMGLRIGAVYHMDSGDNDDDAKTNNTYNPFHYEKAGFGGKMQVLGWGNLTYVGGNVSIAPMENTKVGLDYFAYSRSSNKAALTTINGYSTPSFMSDKSAVGSEIGLWADHNYGDGFSIGGRYGMFTPGEYLMYGLATSAATKTELDPASELEVTAMYKF